MGILSSMERRARLENPRVPISSPNVLQQLDMEYNTPAGVTVNHNKAMGLTAFWNGVRVITQTIAGLPCEVFERTGEKSTRIAREHPVHKLLYMRPNPHMAPFVFKEVRAAHCLTWGNSYAEIEYDNAGRPKWLWPLLPDRTGVEIIDGKKMYYTVIDGARVWLSADRVLHVPGLGFDGIRGYNVVKIHRDSLGLTAAANEYGARFYGNSGRPSGYISHPGQPEQPEREQLRDEWSQVHQGLSRAQQTAVLWGGMKWEAISMPPEEAQFLQTREMQIEEVARILNINPILLQHHHKATTWGSGIAQFLIAYSKFTVTPHLEREEDIINWDMFNENDRGKYYCKYNLKALLRGDPEAQAKVLEIERRNGIICGDEWREFNEMNPLPDGQGQIYTIPLNMVNAAELVPEDPAEGLIDDDVQKHALNGAQIASLLEILRLVTLKELAPGTAKAALKAAFPMLDESLINEMVDDAEKHEMPMQTEDLKERGIINKEQRSTKKKRSAAMRRRLREAHKSSFEDGARRYLKREIDALEKTIRKAFDEGRDPQAALNKWISDFYPGQQQHIKRVMLPVVSALASVVAAEAAEEIGVDPEDIDEFTEQYTDNLASREAGSSRGQILALMKEHTDEGLRDALLTRTGEWSESRPGKVAMDEVTRVATGASRYIWTGAGMGALVWRANADACPLCKEMDGKKVGAKEYFLSAGDSVTSQDRPGGITAEHNIGGPPLHQGCDCDIEPE